MISGSDFLSSRHAAAETCCRPATSDPPLRDFQKEMISSGNKDEHQEEEQVRQYPDSLEFQKGTVQHGPEASFGHFMDHPVSSTERTGKRPPAGDTCGGRRLASVRHKPGKEKDEEKLGSQPGGNCTPGPGRTCASLSMKGTDIALVARYRRQQQVDRHQYPEQLSSVEQVHARPRRDCSG